MVLTLTPKAESTPNNNNSHHSDHPHEPPPFSPRHSSSMKFTGNVVIHGVLVMMAMMALFQSVSSSSRSLAFQSLYDDVTTLAGQYYDSTLPTTTTNMMASSYHQDNDWFFKTILPGGNRNGAITCAMVQEQVQLGNWLDPNHGQMFLRKVITQPSFYISVHNQHYDSLRYTTIFETGDYYEVQVRQRFEYILGENQKAWNYQSSPFKDQKMPLVIDIGGNIGYYTLLSAAWKHAVVTFEINPTNLIRLCESLNYGGQDSQPISIHRQGVSDVTGATVQVTVARNPGATALVPTKKVRRMTNTTEPQVFSVATITLDDFAQQNHWLDQKSKLQVSLLKLDTEGHEPQILEGAHQFIQQQLAKNILVEYRAHCQKAMIELLDAGYAIVDDSNAAKKRFLSRKEALVFLDEESERVRKKKSWEYSDLWLRLATLPFL